MQRLAFAALLLATACSKPQPSEPSTAASPASTPAPTASPAEAQAAGTKLTIVPDASRVTWTMEAPLEKIYGEVPGGVSGELLVDPADPSATTGTVYVDLSKVALFQEKRADAKKPYGTREQNEMQNQHARTWLEISPDVPDEMRKTHERAELRITSVTATAAAARTGDLRTFRAIAAGDFLLHGRRVPKTVEVEVTMKLAGGKLEEVRVKSLKPLEVSLAEHDIRPRDAFGKLAAQTLEAMGSKVTATAPIDVELVAR